MALERKRESGLVGSFIPANPLEELLVRAFREPAERPEFCRRMLESGLLVLGTADDSGVTLRQWTVAGRKMIPIFTSAQRLEEFAPADSQHLALEGRRLLQAIPPGVSAYLNPRSPVGREFPAEEIAALLDGSFFGKGPPGTVPAGERIRLGQPAQYPERLVAALKVLFTSRPGVQAAYLALVEVPGSREGPHLTIGLDAESFEAVAGEAAAVAGDLLGPGQPLDLVRIGTGTVSRYMTGATKPFYVRPEGAARP